MTVWVDRSGWQALPPNRVSPLRDRTDYAVIHHSATPRPRSLEEARAQVQAIQRDHLARLVGAGPLRWADIAYGELAGPGVIFEGRGRRVRSGATGPAADPVSCSLCVLGNYETDDLDLATEAAVADWLRSVFADYGRIPVRLDLEFNPTACPGARLAGRLPALIAQATQEPDMSFPTAAEIAEAVWSRPVGAGGQIHAAANVLGFIVDELQRPDLLQERLVGALTAAVPAARVDLDGDEIARLAGALIAQIPR